jgi:hypothetical protein
MTAHVLGIFALCGFAIAQPIFSLLGEEPTYFVVHGVEGSDLIWFAVALVLVPPILLSGLLFAVRAVSPKAEQRLMTGLVGALVALTIVPAIDRGIGLSDWVFIILLVAVGVGVATAYARLPPARTFVSFLSPAPLLFLVLFLTTSPASALLESGDGDVLAAQDLDTPVVVVVFDEFALGVLLNADATLDTTHFPGFGRLAALSTWYPNATTTAFRTDVAVPAILSGSTRPVGTPPTSSEYPRSLFSMLGASHSVRADEVVTHICPEAVCPVPTPTEGSVVEDTTIAYLHGLLPDGLASSWLPPMGARWGGFADVPTPDSETASDADAGVSTSVSVPEGPSAVEPEASNCSDTVCAPDWDTRRFQGFLSAIEAPSGTPQLLYHHALLPHVPYRYFPDGTNYEPISPTWGLDPSWHTDPDFMAAMRQRYFLQSVYVDGLVGQLLDRLEAMSVLDEAMIVIVADHGVSLEPDTGLRGSPDGNGDTADGVQPVPLFVKLPGQREGAIDDRPTQVVDVLPTIADAVDVDLPEDWDFDGHSLLATPHSTETRRWLDGQLTSELYPESFGASVRSSIVDLPGRSDFVGVGPHGALIGAAVADFGTLAPTGASIELDKPGAYDNVAEGGLLPALFTATTDGLTDDDWVAVAIDDVISGVGPVYNGGTKVVALLDPRTLGVGAHEVRTFVIRGGGTSFEELTITR